MTKTSLPLSRIAPFLILMICLAADSKAQTEAYVELSTSHDSNPFNLRDSWRTEFEQRQVDGERFKGFESISDVVTSLGGAVTFHQETEQKTDIELTLGGFYHRYSSNSLASFPEFNANLDLNPKGAGRYEIDIDWTPRRHRKNYKDATKVFRPGEYSNSMATLSWHRKLTSSLDIEAYLQFGTRNFESPFSNRDQVRKAGGIQLDLELSKKVDVKVSALKGQVKTDNEVEFGIPTDRSYDLLDGKVELQVERGDADFSVWARVRERSYTSSEVADVGRYQRSDVRSSYGAEFVLKLSKRLRLNVEAAHRDNASDRPARLDEEDAIPYTGTSVSGGMRFAL